jgi:hypothetical protein
VTAHVIAIPETGFEFESLTTAMRGEETAEPAAAVCPLPDRTDMLAAAPNVPDSENVAGVATPATDAAMVFVPADTPVVKLH